MKQLLILLIFTTSFFSAHSQYCNIYSIETDVHQCDENGQFTVEVWFEYENVGDLGYQVLVNGVIDDTYDYGELLIIGPFDGDCETEYVITIRDAQLDNCQDETNIGIVCCAENCEIRDLTSEADDCNDDGGFYAILDFNHEGTTNQFDVNGNGIFYGTYNYNALPVLIGPLDGDCETGYEFIVSDHELESCHANTELGIVCCDKECEIWDFNADENHCESNGLFSIDFTFKYRNTPSDSFVINILPNHSNLEVHAYADLPLTLYGFEGDCETTYEFIVFDNIEDGCSDMTESDIICCDELCEIWDLTAKEHECDSNGMFSIEFDFKYRNTSDSFDLNRIPDNHTYGRFAYTDLPVTLYGFNADCESTYEFIVYDYIDDGCSDTVESGVVCCDGEEPCRIWDVSIKAGDCDSMFFFVTIDFEHTGTSDSFDLSGPVGGTYAYSDLPITVGPLYADCMSTYLFTIIDQLNQNCGTESELDPVCCDDEGDCRIWDVVVDKGECDSLGMFYVHINFMHEHTNDSFTVYGNSIYYGKYSYDDLPIRIGPLEGDCVTEYEFLIEDHELGHDCEAVGELGKVCCNEEEECRIWDLKLDGGDCDSLGMFYVNISFMFEHTSDSFEIHGNGQFYGTYAYANLPIRLGPLEGDCETEYEFVIIDQGIDDCRTDGELGKVCCEGEEECNIWDLEVLKGECDSSGQFSVIINFNHTGTGTLFDIRGNGQLYGTYAYADLPITINRLNGDCETEYEFVIIDREDADCNASTELGTVCCDDVSVKDALEHSLIIRTSPNSISIKSDDNLSKLSIQLFSTLGQKHLVSTRTDINQVTIDISKLKAGVYFLYLQSDNQNMVYKFLK